MYKQRSAEAHVEAKDFNRKGHEERKELHKKLLGQQEFRGLTLAKASGC